MKIVRISEKEDLESFGNYSDDVFLDNALWSFISEVKSLAIEFNDPYFPQLFLDDCKQKMRKYMVERGQLNW